LHRRNGAIRGFFAPGRSLTPGTWFALIAVLALVVSISGCNSSSSSGGEDKPLLVESFNQDEMPGVLINSPLEFTFSTDVDASTVNDQTVQIWTQIGGKRVDSIGSFEVVGRKVTWYPAMPSRVYPLDPTTTSGQIMPSDSGLNTQVSIGFTYSVLIPASPNPNTVKSLKNKPMVQPFTSSFETIQGPSVSAGSVGNTQLVKDIFTNKADYFRNTIRVADVLSYGGPVTNVDRFLNWLSKPGSTMGENPLYQKPMMLDEAVNSWNALLRDRTGQQIENSAAPFYIQLVPKLTAAEMAKNVLSRAGDERFISNVDDSMGQKGRGRIVEGLNLWFTQPLAPDAFLTKANNPKKYDDTPIAIRILPTPDADPLPIPVEPFTLTFLNDTAKHAALVNITLNSMVSKGWVHISIEESQVKAMPGASMENNLPGEYVFIWPVMINAQL
jgi:hypothetical protein